MSRRARESSTGRAVSARLRTSLPSRKIESSRHGPLEWHFACVARRMMAPGDLEYLHTSQNRPRAPPLRGQMSDEICFASTPSKAGLRAAAPLEAGRAGGRPGAPGRRLGASGRPAAPSVRSSPGGCRSARKFVCQVAACARRPHAAMSQMAACAHATMSEVYLQPSGLCVEPTRRFAPGTAFPACARGCFESVREAWRRQRGSRGRAGSGRRGRPIIPRTQGMTCPIEVGWPMPFDAL